MKRLFRRRWLIFAFFPFVLLAGGYIWLLSSPDSGLFTKANFDRIQPGMIRLEVEEILDPQARPLVFLDEVIAPAARDSDLSFSWGNPTVPYTDDRPDRFPPSDTIWIEFDRNAHKVISKRYASATAGDYWQHFLTRVSTAIGRSPSPPPRSPVVAIVRPALPADPAATRSTPAAPRQP
jgi:hypothetical protein